MVTANTRTCKSECSQLGLVCGLSTMHVKHLFDTSEQCSSLMPKVLYFAWTVSAHNAAVSEFVWLSYAALCCHSFA